MQDTRLRGCSRRHHLILPSGSAKPTAYKAIRVRDRPRTACLFDEVCGRFRLENCTRGIGPAYTRVTLDSVVHAFNRRTTAEEIVQKFPSLELSDLYQLIGYYLKYRTELSECIKKRELEEDTLLAGHPEWSPAGLRAFFFTVSRLACRFVCPLNERHHGPGHEGATSDGFHLCSPSKSGTALGQTKRPWPDHAFGHFEIG